MEQHESEDLRAATRSRPAGTPRPAAPSRSPSTTVPTRSSRRRSSTSWPGIGRPGHVLPRRAPRAAPPTSWRVGSVAAGHNVGSHSLTRIGRVAELSWPRSGARPRTAGAPWSTRSAPGVRPVPPAQGTSDASLGGHLRRAACARGCGPSTRGLAAGGHGARILDGLGTPRDGDVLLLHDGNESPVGPGAADRSATVAALPGIIDAARERGLRLRAGRGSAVSALPETVVTGGGAFSLTRAAARAVGLSRHRARVRRAQRAREVQADGPRRALGRAAAARVPGRLHARARPAAGVPAAARLRGVPLSALVAWSFVSAAVTRARTRWSADAAAAAQGLLPARGRPCSARIVAAAVDLGSGCVVSSCVGAVLRRDVGAPWLLAPLLVSCCSSLADAASRSLLPGLNVYYRDFRYAIPFLLQLGLFAVAGRLPADSSPSMGDALRASRTRWPGARRHAPRAHATAAARSATCRSTALWPSMLASARLRAVQAARAGFADWS